MSRARWAFCSPRMGSRRVWSAPPAPRERGGSRRGAPAQTKAGAGGGHFPFLFRRSLRPPRHLAHVSCFWSPSSTAGEASFRSSLLCGRLPLFASLAALEAPLPPRPCPALLPRRSGSPRKVPLFPAFSTASGRTFRSLVGGKAWSGTHLGRWRRVFCTQMSCPAGMWASLPGLPSANYQRRGTVWGA